MKRVDYINPIFSNGEIIKKRKDSSKQIKKSKSLRATRSDKKHNIKFPVTPVTQMKLRSYCKEVKRIYQLKGKETLEQTKFNTLLLQYGLQHKEILRWNHEYKDTKTYMHIALLEIEYEKEIGGPHGLAIRQNLSERKVVFHIINSVLAWIEGEGSLEKIL